MQKDMKNEQLGAVLRENMSRPHPKSAMLALDCVDQESSSEPIVGGIFHGKYMCLFSLICSKFQTVTFNSVTPFSDFRKTFIILTLNFTSKNTLTL